MKQQGKKEKVTHFLFQNHHFSSVQSTKKIRFLKKIYAIIIQKIHPHKAMARCAACVFPTTHCTGKYVAKTRCVI
jgi:hypothetical protein